MDKRLEECARLLKLWEEHMNKTGTCRVCVLSPFSFLANIHPTLGLIFRSVAGLCRQNDERAASRGCR